MANARDKERHDNSRDRIAAIVLAAGESIRFSPLGEPKQLVAVDGQPMIAKVVREAAASGADAVFVVLGHELERVSAVIDRFSDVTIINNREYRSGLASSLRAGIAQAGGFDAAMFVLGDLPGLRAADINSVIRAYRSSSAPLALGVHKGRAAHPVIFRNDLWPELQQVSGDMGGRGVVKKHFDKAVKVELPEAASISDIDTLEDHLHVSGGSNSE